MIDGEKRMKENSALSSMQRMLEKYSKKNGRTFEDAMKLFTASRTYKLLFDFDSELWKEGPDYLMGLFEKELVNR